MSSDIKRLLKAIDSRITKKRDERLRGTLGRVNPAGASEAVTVPASRQGWVYVTLPGGTLRELPNTGRGHVPERAGLPVFLIRRHNGDLELDGYDDSLLEGDAFLPGAHGVLPHASSHQDGGTDEVATVTPAAGAIPKADPDGYIGSGWIDPADLTGVTDPELLALAGLVSAADKVPYFTGSGTAALADLSAFARTLIDDAAASNARTTLGLVIGTNVQAQDAELAAIAALTSAADRLPYFTGSGTAALATFSAFARTFMDDADAATVRTTLGLAIGTNVQAYDAKLAAIVGLGVGADILTYWTGASTLAATGFPSFARGLVNLTDAAQMRGYLDVEYGVDVQAYDAELNAIAGLVSAADKLPYFTGSGTASLADLSAVARTLIAQTTQALMRTTGLGLGTIATEAEANYALLAGRAGGQSLTGGTASGNALKLSGSSHATKGGVRVPTDALIVGADAVPAFDIEIRKATADFGSVSDGAGTGNYARFFAQIDSSAFMQAAGFSSANTATAFGQTLANWFLLSVAGAAANGLIIGTSTNKPVIIGVNNAEVARFISTGLTFANAMTLTIDSLAALDSDGLKLKDDGGNLALQVIDGGVVVVGGLTSAGASVLGVKAGTSTNDAAVGGVLYRTTTQTGNVGTGEDDLASYSVPANTLAVNGQSLWFEAWGTLAATAVTKTLRVRFGTAGTNLFFTRAESSISANTWHIRGRITRTGAATQKGFGTYTVSAGVATADSSTALNQTLSGAVTFKVTGEATNNNDIVLEALTVGWDDVNT